MKKTKEILLYSLNVIINPLSPCITLLVGWILTLMVSTTNPHFPQIINYFIEHKYILLYILIIWIVTSIIVTLIQNIFKEKNNEIEQLKTILKEKDNQLNQTGGIILNKYGEFAKFRLKIMFSELLESFVKNNPEIDSIQLYTYSLRKYKKDIIIKISYEEGFADENIDINNILQTYYTIDIDDYKHIKSIVSSWKKVIVSDISNKDKKIILEKMFIEISDMFERIYKKLNNIKSINEIQDKDFNNYRLLTILFRLLGDNKGVTIKTNFLSETKNHIENYLLNGKRTGVLGSILLEDAFIFRHEGITSKHGRLYMCFDLEIYSQNYIILFTIPPYDLEDIEELLKKLENLKNNFIEMLKNR